MRHSLTWSAAAALVTLTGCFYSPVGTNKSTDTYPVPAEDGKVTVTYTPPASKDATQVTFLLEPPAGEEITDSTPQVLDDSPDDGFEGTFDASALDPGLHFVSVFVGDEEEPSGRVAFVKPDPNLETGEDAATDGAAADNEATDQEG